MFDSSKIQQALKFCLEAIVNPAVTLADFFVYLDQANCHINPRELKLLLQQHPTCVAEWLDQAMRERSFGMFGMEITRPPTPLASFSPLLTVKVVGREATVPPKVQTMAIAFLENGRLMVNNAPTTTRVELWVS